MKNKYSISILPTWENPEWVNQVLHYGENLSLQPTPANQLHMILKREFPLDSSREDEVKNLLKEFNAHCANNYLSRCKVDLSSFQFFHHKPIIGLWRSILSDRVIIDMKLDLRSRLSAAGMLDKDYPGYDSSGSEPFEKQFIIFFSDKDCKHLEQYAGFLNKQFPQGHRAFLNKIGLFKRENENDIWQLVEEFSFAKDVALTD